MGNCLEMADKQRILALLGLGWSYRRIQRETGIDRKTVAHYDPRREPKSAKVPIGPAAKAARVSWDIWRQAGQELKDEKAGPRV